jgi:uncharacterized membrane protein
LIGNFRAFAKALLALLRLQPCKRRALDRLAQLARREIDQEMARQRREGFAWLSQQVLIAHHMQRAISRTRRSVKRCGAEPRPIFFLASSGAGPGSAAHR